MSIIHFYVNFFKKNHPKGEEERNLAILNFPCSKRRKSIETHKGQCPLGKRPTSLL